MERHGADLYKMARLLAVHPEPARLAVTEVIETASQPRASLRLRGDAETRRDLGRLVFLACWTGGSDATGRPGLTRARPHRWLDTASSHQRAALALCVYGGHTTSEAGTLLALPAEQVCDLLKGSLRGLKAAAARA